VLIRVSRIANGTAFHDVALTLADNLLAKEYHAHSFSGMASPPQGPAHTTQVAATGANFSQIEE
jgi:hypothetical protein